MGWVARGSSLTIENCLFTPDHFSTKLNKCNTWAVLDTQNVTYSITNSYATTELTDQIETTVIDGKTFMVLHNEADWMKFKNAVPS